MKKIIVYHPANQHSIKVAEGIEKNGMLFKYITSIYDSDISFKSLFLRSLLSSKEKEKLRKRKSKFISDEKIIQKYTFFSLIVIFLSRFNKTKKISNKLDRWISKKFGIAVAKYAIKNNVDAVICFSTNEVECFQYLEKHAPKIVKVCDCANAPLDFMRQLYERDIFYWNSYELKMEAQEMWDEKVVRKDKISAQITDYYLAPSTFVRDGLDFVGVNGNKIKILPYGCSFTIHSPKKIVSDKLQVVYVGQVTYRKGIHHFLNVISNISDRNIQFNIIGECNSEDLMKKILSDNRISYHGRMEHEQIENFLLSCDLMVFPSLSDSFSFACLEAMCCGIPILISNQTGAKDLIKSGFNGVIYDTNDEKQLLMELQKILNNKNILLDYSENAVITAKKYTWDRYYYLLGNFFENLLLE